MQVKVSARHGHLTEEQAAPLREKAEKLLTFFDRLTFIEVTVDFHKTKTTDALSVEILATAEHKHEFVGRGEGADLAVALHAASDKVTQQIKHYKERVQDHRRDPSHNGGQ